MSPTFIAQKQRVTLREISGILTILNHLYLSSVRIGTIPSRNSFRNNPATGVIPNMDHFSPRVCLLVIIRHGHGIKFTDRPVALQYRTRVFPSDSRTRLHLCPNQFGIIPFTNTSFGHEIIDTAFPVLISRVPVLHGTIFYLRVLLYHNLHDSRMQLILVPLRSSTSFQITHETFLFRHDQRALKLPRVRRVDSEISGQLHRTTHPFRDVNE